MQMARLLYLQKESVSTFCFSLNDEGEIGVQICKYTYAISWLRLVEVNSLLNILLKLSLENLT